MIFSQPQGKENERYKRFQIIRYLSCKVVIIAKPNARVGVDSAPQNLKNELDEKLTPNIIKLYVSVMFKKKSLFT